MKRLMMFAAAGLVFSFMFLPGPGQAQVELPGSFYYGDSGSCDGIIAPNDLSEMKKVVAGNPGNYSGCKPPVKDVQDLDGDYAISPTDLAILRTWIAGMCASPVQAGLPFSLELQEPNPVVAYGMSVDLAARVWDNPANGNMLANLRPGWGVIFEILPTSTCPSALLYGLDPSPIIGGGKGQYIIGPKVFDYTDSFVGGGWASVKLYPIGCSPGSHIDIGVSVPGDITAGLPPCRFPNPLVSPVNITANVMCGAPVTGISINQPDPITLAEGASVNLTATCTYGCGGWTDDCSSGIAGGITWSVTGDLTVTAGGKLKANQVPCGDGGSGAVTAKPVNFPAVSDANQVTVNNNDTINYTFIEPSVFMGGLSMGSQLQLHVYRYWTDACVQDLSYLATWYTFFECGVPIVVNGPGMIDIGFGFCPTGCCTCYVGAMPADNSPVALPINDPMNGGCAW